MKKLSLRIFSLLLVVVTLFSAIPAVSAYTVTSASLSSNSYGGNKTVFYVNTDNTKTAKIKYTCAAGAFLKSDEKISYRYGYWEIRIWGRNSTSESWTELSKQNIKNDYTGTVKMSGYTQYRVQIYAWKTTTIGKTLGGKYNWTGACWFGSYPTITFKAYTSNISHLAKI